MGLDKMYADAMLGTFRSMYQECLEKNKPGEKLDLLTAIMNRMEAVAQTANDISELQGTLLQEDLMSRFSLAYSELLAESYQEQHANGGYTDDQALLAQNLKALEDAIQAIDESDKEAKDSIRQSSATEQISTARLSIFQTDVTHRYNTIKNAIQNLVDLGRSSENYPTFLRLQLEKGLDKAAEGTVVVEEVYEEEAVVAQIQRLSPYHIQRSEAIRQAYASLAAKAPFGVPHAIDIELERYKIEHRFEPAIRQWNLLTDRWEELISTLTEWAASQCPRAMYVAPWALIPLPERPEAIRFSKHCCPGILKEQIRLFKQDFDMDFRDVFSHETFIHYINEKRSYYSQEYMVHLLNVVYPLCLPKQLLPQRIIDKDQKIYDDNRYVNPEEQPALINYRKWFDEKYGEGTLEGLIGEAEPFQGSAAAAWDYEEFIRQINLE